jgi:hypothetical protein
MKSINELIVEQAQQWVGVKEIKDNILFNKKGFKKFIEASGQKDGEAYCIYFAESCVTFAYIKSGNSDVAAEYSKIITPNAVQSFKNAEAAGLTSGTPQIGSIAIWQMFKDGEGTTLGHGGVVEHINFANNNIFTIEGNTGNPDERTGDGVYRKTKSLFMTKKENGLVLLGFIIPKQVEMMFGDIET